MNVQGEWLKNCGNSAPSNGITVQIRANSRVTGTTVTK